MQKIGEHIFIKTGALPVNFCEGVIAKFETDSRKANGLIGPYVFNPDVKQSKDLRISGLDDWKSEDEIFYASLSSELALLRPIYPHTIMAGNDDGYQIQKTEIGGFYSTHIDWSVAVASRSLVVIWYLNTVEVGGETRFDYQELSVKPEVGKMLVFPPYWMYPHSGLPPVSNSKYICTTWLQFN